MSRLRSVRPQEVVRVLERLGFRRLRQKGSHAFFEHPDGRRTVVPLHAREIGRGLLRQILADIGLTPDEFADLL